MSFYARQRRKKFKKHWGNIKNGSCVEGINTDEDQTWSLHCDLDFIVDLGKNNLFISF